MNDGWERRGEERGRKEEEEEKLLQPAPLHAPAGVTLPLALHHALISLLSSVPSFMHRYRDVRTRAAALLSPPLSLFTSALSNLKSAQQFHLFLCFWMGPFVRSSHSLMQMSAFQ